MQLRKNRLKLFILSGLLISMCSGLLFYRELFLDEIKVEQTSKNSLEEIRVLDREINMALFETRANFNLDSEEILDNKNKVNDLLNIIFEGRKDNKAIGKSLLTIKNYFEDKNKTIDNYLLALREVQTNVKKLNLLYNDLQKNNIKFTLDNRDFYRECISDAYLYLIYPSKDVEWRFEENLKVLGQIQSFSKKPIPAIDNFVNSILTIKKKSKEMDSHLIKIKESNVISEINTVIKHDVNIRELGQSRGQKFLMLIFASVTLYIIAVLFVLFKV